VSALVAGSVLVAAVAAVISFPLFRGSVEPLGTAVRTDDTLEHEKSIALLAIKEAEFDHAMGKLADGDYSVLRSEYEERALSAIRGLEGRTDTPEASSAGATGNSSGVGTWAGYCHRCGRQFDTGDRYCASCGTARLNLATPVEP